MKRDARTGASTGALRPMLVVFGLGSAGLPAAGQVIRYGPPEVYDDLGVSRYVVAADLNGDGAVDLAVRSGESVLILHGDGTGGLHEAAEILCDLYSQSLYAADIDSNGSVDLVWYEGASYQTGSIVIWYNSGDGRVGQRDIIEIPEDILALHGLGDLDGNGIVDLLVSDKNNRIGGLFGAADGAFEFRWLYEHGDVYHVRSPSLGDFDRDGDLDVIVPMQALYGYSGKYDGGRAELVLLHNDGSGNLSAVQEERIWFRSSDRDLVDSTVVGDIDGDGDLDVIIANGTNGYYSSEAPIDLILFKSVSDGTFVQVDTMTFGSGAPGALALADVSVDGRLDVVVTTSRVDGVYAFQNAGPEGFILAPAFPSFIDSWRDAQLAVSDLNGDGLHDIVTMGRDGMSILLNETTPAGPRLGHEPLVRGELVTIGVANAQPGDRVHFLYSFAGTGNSLGIPQLGGITLDLLDPIVKFADGIAGDTGRLDVLVRIPANAPLGPVALQAVVRRGLDGSQSVKSPFVVGVIED